MGFLALMALSFGLVPLLFSVPDGVHRVFDALEWIITGLFALEYAVSLSRAPDRRAFMLGAWRMLDAFIIVAPIVSLLPQVSDALRSSPALRILRLLRAILFGARAGTSMARHRKRRGAPAKGGSTAVSRWSVGGHAQPSTWQEVLSWAPRHERDWYHVASVASEKVDELAHALSIDGASLRASFSGASFPRIEPCGSFTSLFVWLPGVGEDGAIDRTGVMLLAAGDGALTLSQHSTDLHQSVGAALPAGGALFSTRMALALLRLAVQRNEEAAGVLERELRTLEEVSVPSNRDDFFEKTFRLKRELSEAKADVWRLKGMLSGLADGRRSLPGLGEPERELVKKLADEADYLYETVDNVREGLLSVIDLHLNVVSFEMNKVMRLLAVASVLGLVPAVIGGMFGMNLDGNPWPLTLPQVSFGVGMAMLLALYVFLAKGWLR